MQEDIDYYGIRPTPDIGLLSPGADIGRNVDYKLEIAPPTKKTPYSVVMDNEAIRNQGLIEVVGTLDSTEKGPFMTFFGWLFSYILSFKFFMVCGIVIGIIVGVAMFEIYKIKIKEEEKGKKKRGGGARAGGKKKDIYPLQMNRR